jgi:hypothetical protein
VAVNFMHHMPVIGLKAFCRVIGKPAFGFAINGNAVVVVEADQLAQSQRPRQSTLREKSPPSGSHRP